MQHISYHNSCRNSRLVKQHLEKPLPTFSGCKSRDFHNSDKIHLHFFFNPHYFRTWRSLRRSSLTWKFALTRLEKLLGATIIYCDPIFQRIVAMNQHKSDIFNAFCWNIFFRIVNINLVVLWCLGMTSQVSDLDFYTTVNLRNVTYTYSFNF